MDVLRVSSKSDSNAVASAIAHYIKENRKVEMQAIGAGAVNQAVKTIANARGFVAPQGIDLICIPAFSSVTVDNKERTAIRFIVELR